MAAINGSLFILKVKYNGDWLSLLASEQSHTLNINQDNPTAITKGSAGWTPRIAGSRDWDVSIDGLIDPTSELSEKEIFDIIKNREDVEIQSGSDEIGSVMYEGKALISTFAKTSEAEQPASFSATFEANGPLEESIVGS
jgi:predicted secreted protein